MWQARADARARWSRGRVRTMGSSSTKTTARAGGPLMVRTSNAPRAVVGPRLPPREGGGPLVVRFSRSLYRVFVRLAARSSGKPPESDGTTAESVKILENETCFFTVTVFSLAVRLAWSLCPLARILVLRDTTPPV